MGYYLTKDDNNSDVEYSCNEVFIPEEGVLICCSCRVPDTM